MLTIVAIVACIAAVGEYLHILHLCALLALTRHNYETALDCLAETAIELAKIEREKGNADAS